MFSWKEFERARNILGESGRVSYSEALGQHHVSIRPKDLLRWMELASDDLGYVVLLDLTCVDHDLLKDPHRFELVYHLLNMGSHQRLNLHVHFSSGEIVPSVRKFYSHAGWLEREQAEMFNIRFDLEVAPLVLTEGQTNFPLKKDAVLRGWPLGVSRELPKRQFNPNKSETPWPEESYEWKRFSILSPETMGNFEWMVCFDPVKVVDSKVEIGFHHQGLEKKLESMNWMQVQHYVQRINEGASPHYTIAWVKTLEEMMSVRLPERAQAIRIIMLELSRIAEHLTVLHEICYALKKDEHRVFLDAREKVYELFEKYCGHRQGFGVARLGGVKEDLPHGWIVEYQAVASILLKTLPLVNNELFSQKNFRDSLGGDSVSAQTILQWGVGGPAMRAAGVNFDLRKSQPFYFYQDIDFDIPVGIYGRAYDRYLIRLEEIFQGLRIITQVIDNLPLGSVISEQFDGPAMDVLKKMNAETPPVNWHSSSLESPNGEAGFSLLAGEGWKIERLRIKTPGLILAQALPALTLGLREDELRATIASFGLRRTEIDR
ncbi:MAG: NADH-quinone oxidoreductase subunit C [Bacteriovoracaceae bacterium]